MNKLLLNGEFLPFLEQTTKYAGKSIDISTFKAEINDKPRGQHLSRYFEILAEKAKQGIKIRLLLNFTQERHSTAKTNFNVMRELKNAGVDVRYPKKNRCCHAKIAIIDGIFAFLGSHNLSVRSCHNNFELSIYISEPEMVHDIQTIFNATFDAATKW